VTADGLDYDDADLDIGDYEVFRRCGCCTRRDCSDHPQVGDRSDEESAAEQNVRQIPRPKFPC
jgi:hypothetical protein